MQNATLQQKYSENATFSLLRHDKAGRGNNIFYNKCWVGQFSIAAFHSNKGGPDS